MCVSTCVFPVARRHQVAESNYFHGAVVVAIVAVAAAAGVSTTASECQDGSASQRFVVDLTGGVCLAVFTCEMLIKVTAAVLASGSIER